MPGPDWRKSSYSRANGNCTEVAAADGAVLVRDSRQGDAGPALRFRAADWRAFTVAVKARPPQPFFAHSGHMHHASTLFPLVLPFLFGILAR